MPENVYYVGQPTRVNGKTNSYMAYGFFSTPAEEIIAKKNTTDIRAELIMSTAESYFLQAEAVAKGLTTGDDNALYQEGIRRLWNYGV